MSDGIVAHLIANLVVQVVHEPAFLNGQNLVEGPSDVETQRIALELTSRCNFLVCKVTAVGSSEVQFVAVSQRLH